MQKLYAYVDETGQETHAPFFLVSVVIVEGERERIEQVLERIERISKKGTRKWNKAKDERRTRYIELVFRERVFVGKLYFSVDFQKTDFVEATISATAEAIKRHTQDEYKATVLVDGLKKTERNRFAVGLRRQGVRTDTVRGRKDEVDIFIRLADALCGFLRQALTGREAFQKLMEQALLDGLLTRVGK